MFTVGVIFGPAAFGCFGRSFRRQVSALSGGGGDSLRPCVCTQTRRAADAAGVQLRSLLFFYFLALRAACRGARSALACGCCWRVSFALSCCLHVFCRVEFLTLGVFLRNRQPADPQADRPAGEGAAIPSVEVSKWRPTSRGVPAFFLLGAHLALLGSS